jgi:hypothetical protein
VVLDRGVATATAEGADAGAHRRDDRCSAYHGNLLVDERAESAGL